MRTIFVALRALAVVGLLVLLWWWVALGVRNLDQQFGLALPPRAALAGAHLFVVCFEEPNLRTKFSAAYQNYCKAVPRWVPRRKAWQSED